MDDQFAAGDRVVTRWAFRGPAGQRRNGMVHGDLDPSARRWPDPGGLDGLGTNAVGTVHLSGSIPLVNTPAWSLIPLLVRDHFGGGPAEWGWFSVARNAGSLVGGMLMGT
jgi:hypothetical protein